MRLIDVLTGFFWICLAGRTDIDICGISDDTRKIKPGEVFVCIEGAVIDGHDKIEEAIDKGAAAIIVSRPDVFYSSGVTWIQTSDTRLAAAKMAAAFFDNPSEKMTMIGITGTKGKTTTAYMLKQIFVDAGHKTGMIGTVEIDDGRMQQPSERTTPAAVDLQRYLAQMVTNGVDTVIMEVSSQGLKQKRTAGILFDVGILTNISRDHIGKNEHADMAEYIHCKSLLFKQCKMGIVNKDNALAVMAASDADCALKYFSIKTQMTDDLLIFRAGDGTTFPLKTNMKGDFNLENAFAAAVAADALRIQSAVIARGLMHVYVRGRMEIIPGFNDFTVMIDYAHNAVALECLLRSVRKEHPQRIICMFGCGGNRAKQRRYEMGRISGQLADLTVVTTDNPRFEPPEVIIEDILEGLKTTDGEYVIVPNRGKAIDYCINQAKCGDVIILAGKGHECYQEICGKKYEFNEKQYIQEHFL